MANLTFKEPAPAREFETIGVDEEVLQTFAGGQFVMSQANGRYIVYDGTTDPSVQNVNWCTEPGHNYPVFRAGGSKMEVFKKDEYCELEITAYNAGTVLTAAQLKIGTSYGVTLVPSGTTGNKTGKAIWVLDIAKTVSTQLVLRITATDLRGFGSTGRMAGDTGTIGDQTVRVLAHFVNLR